MPHLHRRQLLQTSAIIGSSAVTVAKIVTPTRAAEGKPLAVGTRILFQGDSITDAHRDRKSDKANDATGLGNGYPLFAAGEMLRDHADLGSQVFSQRM